MNGIFAANLNRRSNLADKKLTGDINERSIFGTLHQPDRFLACFHKYCKDFHGDAYKHHRHDQIEPVEGLNQYDGSIRRIWSMEIRQGLA